METVNDLESVSLIIPVHNSFQFAESIKNSILENLEVIGEVILVNDGGDSRDFLNLTNVVKQAHESVKSFSYVDNKGPWFARNYGVDHSSYPIISFLDSDDILPSGSLRSRLGLLLSHPKAMFVTSGYKWVINNSVKGHNLVPNRFSKEDLLQTCFVCTPSVVLRRETFRSVAGFRNIKAEDYDLWLRLLDDKTTYALGDNNSYVLIRKSAGSVSSNKFLSMTWHIKILRKNVSSNSRLVIYFGVYLLNIFVRRFLKIKSKPLILKSVF
jgi:teichuronic acid biosynthesis glycosyltransferase TuaG